MKTDFETYIKNRNANKDLSFLKRKTAENAPGEAKETSKIEDLSPSNRMSTQNSQFEGLQTHAKNASFSGQSSENAQNAPNSSPEEGLNTPNDTQNTVEVQNLAPLSMRNADSTPFWVNQAVSVSEGAAPAASVNGTQSHRQKTSHEEHNASTMIEASASTQGPTLPPIGKLTKIKLALERVLTFWKAKEARRSLGAVPDQKQEKSKQTRHLLLGGAVAVGIVVAFVLLGDVTQKRPVPEVKVYQSDFRVAPQTIDKQSFQFQYDEKLDLVNAKLKTLDATMENLQSRLKALDKEKMKHDTRNANTQNAVSLDAMPDFHPEGTGVRPEEFLPKAGSVTHDNIKKLNVVKVYEAKQSNHNAAVTFGQAMSSGAGVYGNGSMEDTVLGPRNYRHYRAESPIATNRARFQAENTYLPAGSFAQAVVLSGVTAATGGHAANNPVPLLLKISDMARLPNQFRANVKSCFVTGSATGDLSSERVWIRLDRLSCMSKRGKAIDVKVQGYATGEDGKTGVRARLVTRSGQAIASAITTGLLSGMGKAVSMSASSTVTYSSGASGTTVNDSLKAGVGQGMQDAMDRIVDYYIRLADKIFPVLELDSGRKVDIVLSQGLTIDLNENDAALQTSTKTDAQTQTSTQSHALRAADISLVAKNAPSR